MPSLESYNDIKIVLDKAIASGGGTYRLKSPGSAISWRHRANAFRKAYREATGDMRYEMLILRHTNGESSILIEGRDDAHGEFTPLADPREIPLPPSKADAPLSAEDELLLKDIKGKLDL